MRGSGISAAPGSSVTAVKENRALKILAGCALAALLIAAGFLLANLLHPGGTARESADTLRDSASAWHVSQFRAARSRDFA